MKIKKISMENQSEPKFDPLMLRNLFFSILALKLQMPISCFFHGGMLPQQVINHLVLTTATGMIMDYEKTTLVKPKPIKDYLFASIMAGQDEVFCLFEWLDAKELASWYDKTNRRIFTGYIGIYWYACVLRLSPELSFSQILFISRVINFKFKIFTYPVYQEDGRCGIYVHPNSYPDFRAAILYEVPLARGVTFRESAAVSIPREKRWVDSISAGKYTLEVIQAHSSSELDRLENSDNFYFSRSNLHESLEVNVWYSFTETIYADDDQTIVQEQRRMYIKGREMDRFIHIFFGEGGKDTEKMGRKELSLEK